MPDILRIKRRVTGLTGAPTSLANAELAYNEVSHTLYYGEGTGGSGGSATTVVPIGGTGAFATNTYVDARVATIATIAALRTATTATLAASNVQVRSYAGTRTRGGGTFLLVSTDTTSADNGGTIIVDASNRRWYRAFAEDSPVNVTWFGALGDGTTNDLAAINAAIAFVAIAGGTVFFPSGTYAVTGLITIRASNVLLIGAGAGNWMYGGEVDKGTTIKYVGAVTDGGLITMTVPVPGGIPGQSAPQFMWGMAVRDMNIDCNYLVGEGILTGSVCNSDFSNLNILGATSAGIYVATAATTQWGYSERNNFRNINITLAAAAHGVVLDGVIGAAPNVGYGAAFNHFENVQVTHTNGIAYVLLFGDDNAFFNCSASRASGGIGFGCLFNGTSDGSFKAAQNNIFIWGCFAATPTGTASPIRAIGGTYPSLGNRIIFSQMDGPVTLTIDDGAMLHWETTGSYVSGATPEMMMPGIYGLDAKFGSISHQTRLQITGGQNYSNPLINVYQGIVPGGGAQATLPQFTVPMLPSEYTLANLPVMHPSNTGCVAYCVNGRKPQEGAGAGSGVLVFWSAGVWTSVCSGLAVTA